MLATRSRGPEPQPQLRRSVYISTDSVPASQRRNYWHEHFGSMWGDITSRSIAGVPLRARLRSTQLGPLRLNEVDGSGWAFGRKSSANPAFFSLAFPISGCAAVNLDGRAVNLTSGYVYLLDNSVQGDFATSPSYATCNVQIPATLLERRLLPASPILQVPLSPAAGCAAMLHDYVRALHANAAQIPEHAANLFARQLCELVVFMVDGAEGLQSEDSSVISAHRRRVLAFVAEHSDDSDLFPAKIARACGVSRSYLHRIFHGSSDSVMQRVRRVRLERARGLLEDPLSRDQNVAEVGYRVGFNSAAEFSRAFKQAFGVSPVELRRARRARPDGAARGARSPARS